MKPQQRPFRARSLSRYDEAPADHRWGPLIDWEFQAPRFGNHFGGGDAPERRPGLSALAKEVGANRSFRLESAVLGFVALVSAWPIAIMIHEVIRLLAN